MNMKKKKQDYGGGKKRGCSQVEFNGRFLQVGNFFNYFGSC